MCARQVQTLMAVKDLGQEVTEGWRRRRCARSEVLPTRPCPAKKLNRHHHRHSHLNPPAQPETHTVGMDHSRDPCPWVILNDFGGAFAMGVCAWTSLCTLHYTNEMQAVGGAVWHGVKGVCAIDSPRQRC